MPIFALIIVILFAAGNVIADVIESDSTSTTTSSEAPQPEQSAPSKKNAKKNTSAEGFVMPVTQWLEKKAHRSKVLNPTIDKVLPGTAARDKTALRRAISQAQKTYPGTVLSAVRETTESNHSVFRIKILSANGVIKEIDINDADKSEKKQP